MIEFVAGGDLMFHMQNQRRLPEDHARFVIQRSGLGRGLLNEQSPKPRCLYVFLFLFRTCQVFES